MAIIIVAPRNAPIMIAINPFMVSMSVVMLPFSSSITIATPKLAPLFIPKMEKTPEKFKEIYSCTGMNRRIYCIRKKGETPDDDFRRTCGPFI